MSFAACDESPKPKTAVAPVIASKKSVPVQVAAKPQTVDAGSIDFAAVVDALALPHETPSVDHLSRARTLEQGDDLNGALIEARRALYTSAADENAVELVAKIARRTGKPALAATAWERLATFRPDDALPLIQQARALFQAKDFTGMIAAAREAIARDSESAEAHHLAGLGQLSRGELTQAMASFERAVEIAPEHGYALNNLGLTYLRANENVKALEVLERASSLLPNISYVQNNYGVALERTGHRDEAKSAYQHAMDLSPKYVKARINAARVAKVQLESDDLGIEDDVHAMPDMQ